MLLKRRWSKEEEEYLIKHYPFADNLSIATALNRTEYAVIDRAVRVLNIEKDQSRRRENISKGARQYHINHNYFDEINTHEKAYWYGFIWADGSIVKNSLQFALKTEDKYAIEKLKKVLNSEHSILENKRTNSWRLSIHSYKFVNSLARINIIPRKTYSPLTPILTDEFFLSFFLGLFDGDGYIGKKQINITNTPETCLWLQKQLYEIYQIRSFIKPIKNTHAHRLVINRIQDRYQILSKSYEKLNFYLKRKHNVYIEFVNKYKNKLTNDDPAF